MSDEEKKEVKDGEQEQDVKQEVEIKPEEESELEKDINDEIDGKLINTVDEIVNPKEDTSDKNKDVADESKKEDVTETDKTDDEVDDESTSKGEEDSKTTKTAEKQVEELHLPNRLIQAAKRNHIPAEKILSWGDNAENMLLVYADASDKISERLGEIGRNARKYQPEKKKEDELSTLKVDEDIDSEEVVGLKKYVNQLVSKVSKMEERLTERDKLSTQSFQLERDRKIDSFFDTVNKDFPEFGTSKTLTTAEQVMRQNLWEIADNIMIGSEINGEKIELDDALQQAISIYEGKNPKKKSAKAREKIVDEVKEREKQHIARPRSKKTINTQKTGDEQAVAAVDKILRDKESQSWE